MAREDPSGGSTQSKTVYGYALSRAGLSYEDITSELKLAARDYGTKGWWQLHDSWPDRCHDTRVNRSLTPKMYFHWALSIVPIPNGQYHMQWSQDSFSTANYQTITVFQLQHWRNFKFISFCRWTTQKLSLDTRFVWRDFSPSVRRTFLSISWILFFFNGYLHPHFCSHDALSYSKVVRVFFSVCSLAIPRKSPSSYDFSVGGSSPPLSWPCTAHHLTCPSSALRISSLDSES